MASDLEGELLASDNETSPSISAQPSVLAPSTTVSTSLPMDASGTQQLFQQFVQILDNKLDHTLASFKRNFDDKDEHHTSQLKKSQCSPLEFSKECTCMKIVYINPTQECTLVTM